MKIRRIAPGIAKIKQSQKESLPGAAPFGNLAAYCRRGIAMNLPRIIHNPSFFAISACVLLGASTGCSGPAQGSGGPVTNATVQSGQTANTKPPTKPDGTSTSGTTASTTKPPSTPAAPSPFHVVADVDYELELQNLGKNGVLLGGGQLLPIRDNTVTFEPKFALTQEMRGDGVMGQFMGLHGSFPDALFAAVVRPSGRTGLTELYKWSGTKWASHYSTAESTFVQAIQPWQNGTVLLVESDSMSGGVQFSAFPQGSKVFLPEPHDKKRRGGYGLCESGFVPDTLGTLPSGHAFMSGVTCSPDGSSPDGQIGVKHWSPENPKGTVDILPEIGNQVFETIAVVLRTEKDGYVAGNLKGTRMGQSNTMAPYLAHFDGKSWVRDTLPTSDALLSLDVDAQGKVWLVSAQGVVYSRPSGGAWNEISTPRAGKNEAPISAKKIWVRAPGDEWIVGAYESRYVVLHSGPAAPKAELPDLETMEDKVADLAMPTPLTSRCYRPFALLFTLSKVAPPDFDYPATREALKGHTEFADAQFIEFKRLDKRFMGAFVSDVDMGKKLVELIKKKVPNSTPQLVCHSPRPTRELTMDFSR